MISFSATQSTIYTRCTVACTNNIVCENIIHSRQSRSHTYKAIYRDDSTNINKNKRKKPNVHNP